VTGDYTRVTPPGQEGSITVTLNTRKFRKPISKTVTVTTNAPRSKRVVLTMKADVRSPLVITPDSRADFRVYQGEGATRLLGLTIRADSPARLVDVQSSNKLFTVDCTPWAANEDASEEELALFQGDGSHHRLEVRLSPEAQVGYHSARITVYLDGSKTRQVEVKGLARVMGRIHFNPQWIYFGSVTAGEEQLAEQVLEVRAHGDLPFNVTGVEYEGLPLTWEIRPLENGSGTDIHFRWEGSEPAGIHKGRVKLTTDTEAQPTLEVPFSINVLAGKTEGKAKTAAWTKAP
jgi:hypothetical protein